MSVAAGDRIVPRSTTTSRMAQTFETISLRILALVIILGLWEGVLQVGLATEFWVSRPRLVLQRLVEWLLVEGTIWAHLATTLEEVILGLVGGVILGIVFGFALAKWRRLHVALDPYIMGLYGMPRAALAPLFIMWLGIGLESKVALAGFVACFVLLVNTYTGVKNVDVDLVDAVRTMGASHAFIVRKVVLPACVPWIMSGTRIGLSFALTGAIFAEMLAAQRGIGWVVARASGMFDTTGVFASLIILAVVAMGLNEGMKKLERRLLRWRGEVVL